MTDNYHARWKPRQGQRPRSAFIKKVLQNPKAAVKDSAGIELDAFLELLAHAQKEISRRPKVEYPDRVRIAALVEEYLRYLSGCNKVQKFRNAAQRVKEESSRRLKLFKDWDPGDWGPIDGISPNGPGALDWDPTGRVGVAIKELRALAEELSSVLPCVIPDKPRIKPHSRRDTDMRVPTLG